MIIYPAIDILGGECVRLLQGQYDRVSKYAKDPLQVAQKFAAQCAEFLHIVDLDGAKEGKPINKDKILEIASKVDLPIQVGGGIRDLETASEYLNNGINRVILGSSAIKTPVLVSQILENFGPDRLVVSLDLKNGELATDGWLKNSGQGIVEVLSSLKKLGVETFIVTDINKDGTLEEPNFELYKGLVQDDYQIIAAGGISQTKDIEKLDRMGVNGAIIGKALYEGTISLTKNTLAKRIIPCMDIDNGRVVKGTYFKNLQDAGDPVELAKYYSQNGADELVFLDITATVQQRKTLIALVKKIAKNIYIPFTVGGGISSLKDIDNLLKAGADKVSLGSIAVTNPGLIKEAAKRFGSQCIVISLDCSRSGDSWEIYIKGGREATGIDAPSFAKKMESLGAGELLVNSLDRDGTKQGYDLKLLRSLNVNIPIIASSGAGTKKDFLEAFTKGNADAALAATLFHYKEIFIPTLKKYLSSNNITIRPC